MDPVIQPIRNARTCRGNNGSVGSICNEMISIDLPIHRWHYAATSGMHNSRKICGIHSSCAHRFIIEAI